MSGFNMLPPSHITGPLELYPINGSGHDVALVVAATVIAFSAVPGEQIENKAPVGKRYLSEHLPLLPPELPAATVTTAPASTALLTAVLIIS